jgi:hypothetical protein
MPRKARRTRLRGGMTPTEHWALKHGVEMLPAHDPDPWPDEDAARMCWRKNRAQLMAEALPGFPPMSLFRHELESFDSKTQILALRLDRISLSKGTNEFESCAAWHRRHGRIELAEEFQRRAARVRVVIGEMA